MEIFKALEGLVSSQMHVIRASLSLTKLEARLALLSIFPLIINIGLLFAVLLSLWLTTMGLLGYGLVLILDNYLYAGLGLLSVNVLLLVLLLWYLKFNLDSMSFKNTRAYLSRGKYERQKTSEANNSDVG